MSPQSRRGRAVPASQRKTASHGASAASRKPAAAVDEVNGQVDDEQDDDVVAAPVRPGRRQRGFARVRRTSGYRYANELLGAYVPLIVAFVVLFAVVWGYISFGPHTPSPRENWTSIETQWRPKREADLKKVATAVAANDVQASLDGYKAVADDTKGWMGALSAITTWSDPNVASVTSTTAPEAVAAFIQDGNKEVNDLAAMASAKTINDILGQKDTIDADESSLNTDYALAYLALFATNPTASSQPTIGFPAGTFVPSPSPGPSESPSVGPSTAPSPAGSTSPGASSAVPASPSVSPAAS